MKTYVFYHKNSSICVTTSANSEEEARRDIEDHTTKEFVDYLRLESEEDEDE